MTLEEEIAAIPQPYRLRLRAAIKALCWWKPWNSYYGAIEACQGRALHMADEAYLAGLRASTDERIRLPRGVSPDDVLGFMLGKKPPS